MKLRLIWSILLFLPAVVFAGEDITYTMKFSNLTQEKNMSLSLESTEGVSYVRGINQVNPVSLPVGNVHEVNFLVKGNSTSWQIRFKVCRDSLINSANGKCNAELESICKFDASGVGDLPFYSSDNQHEKFRCTPDIFANKQLVNISVQD